VGHSARPTTPRPGDVDPPGGPPHAGVTARPYRPAVMTTALRGRPGSADDPASPGRRPLRLRGDLIAVAVAALLVTASSVVGWRLIEAGVPVLVGWPPLLASWMPHVGPGTVPAVLVALLVALGGPAVARRLRWGPLLAVAYAASLAWTFALATIDGWYVGIAERLATPTEYLAEIPRTPDIAVFLQTFAERIAGQTPDTLVTHSAGHPPAATLIYVLLDRLGFPGGEYAGVFTTVIGASAVVAVGLTLAALADRDLARTYLPFGVLFPGAVWVGVSADGMFAAVLAWGVALLALGAVRRGVGGAVVCLLAGVVLGLSLFLSYGLVLAGLLPVAVALVTRRVVPLLAGGVGAALVVAAFAFAGFWWYEGYEQVTIRYYQEGEYGLLRPYEYWVWANLAAVVLVLGPAVIAGLRRAVWRPRAVPAAVLALAAAGTIAILVADLSGLSKSEVERIWLPFAVWLVPLATLLPRPAARWWLLAQAALALTVNHLLLTVW
jgi:methylthioxylose transferase